MRLSLALVDGLYNIYRSQNFSQSRYSNEWKISELLCDLQIYLPPSFMEDPLACDLYSKHIYLFYVGHMFLMAPPICFVLRTLVEGLLFSNTTATQKCKVSQGELRNLPCPKSLEPSAFSFSSCLN